MLRPAIYLGLTRWRTSTARGSHGIVSSSCSRTLLKSLTDHPGTRLVWDLAAPAGASGASVLHLAAAAGDGGAAAGLLLARSPEAGALWCSLQDHAGQTPQDIADRCAADTGGSPVSPIR